VVQQKSRLRHFSETYLSDLSDYETNVVIGNLSDQILELANELTINQKGGKNPT
jgi:hypothetical protein